MDFVKAVGLGLMMTVAGGCNPNDFDTALDKAPVTSFENGSSSGSLFVLPLASPPPTGSVAGRMLVSRKGSAYLALTEYDRDGKASVHQASETDLANLGNTGVNSAAALGPDGPIILGTPGAGQTGSPAPGSLTPPAPGRVSLLTLTTGADGKASLNVRGGPQGINHFGISVAAGRVTDLNGAGEFVVVSDDAVDLLNTDASTVVGHAACQAVDLSDSNAGIYASRPVVVANLIAGGGEEIILSGHGRVVFLQYDSVSKSLVCLPLVLSQTVQSSFGTSLVAADFDGDGNMDLAVGTPPDKVYVYFGPLPLDPAAAEFVTLDAGAAASSFGKRIAAYPMPAPEGARLMVADPSASDKDRRSGAGHVMLVSVSRAAKLTQLAELPVTPATLFDSNTDSPVGVFGDSLGTLQFDTRLCDAAGGPTVVPWATSGTSVLTYFDYPGNLSDPRCSK